MGVKALHYEKSAFISSFDGRLLFSILFKVFYIFQGSAMLEPSKLVLCSGQKY